MRDPVGLLGLLRQTRSTPPRAIPLNSSGSGSQPFSGLRGSIFTSAPKASGMLVSCW